jgi:hypothetical protein
MVALHDYHSTRIAPQKQVDLHCSDAPAVCQTSAAPRAHRQDAHEMQVAHRAHHQDAYEMRVVPHANHLVYREMLGVLHRASETSAAPDILVALPLRAFRPH